MRILENLCMLLPKALKMRAIKDTMALVADGIGGTKCAPAQMSRDLRHLDPALLNWQGMSTHPKMENGGFSLRVTEPKDEGSGRDKA